MKRWVELKKKSSCNFFRRIFWIHLVYTYENTSTPIEGKLNEFNK